VNTLTHTSMATFRLCKGRWYWSAVLGIRALKKSPSLLLGGLLHLWLEAWFLAGWDHAAELLTDAMLADLDPYDRAMLRAMCLAYHCRWAGDRARWRVLHVEVKFRAPIINPATGKPSRLYELSGRIDLIVQDIETGQVWIVEHKSSGADLSPSSTYWLRLRLDPQISIYVAGARTLGLDPVGVIYDVVGKPDREPLRATPPDRRKYTQGKGCKLCGGKVGVKGDGLKRPLERKHEPCNDCDGMIDAHRRGDPPHCFECGTDWPCDYSKNPPAQKPCPACDNGWMHGEAPRLYADQREEDESPGAFGLRCFADLLNPDRALLHRREVARLDDEMAEHAHDVWQTAKDAHEVVTRATLGKRPSRNPDACFAFYRECEFYGVCTGSASIDDPELFTRVGAHPELADRVHLPVINEPFLSEEPESL